MRVPESLAGLLDQGIVQEIVRPLMSGKEAQVYLVIAGGQPRVAKIYKDSQHRSFQQRAEYTEGRRTRNSRDQRAMQKRTKYGREQDEAAWKSAEVDMIYRLRYAGVRVPEPFTFVDGVLLMELVTDADGNPAPRLAEVDFTREEARGIFELLLQEVIKMLCAGVVHGDLSEYNVLLAESGPVIIDFPQSVDAAANHSAKRLLLRDVDNLTRFLMRLDHRAHRMPYGQEIWSAYERNRLTPGMSLTGRAQRSTGTTDTRSLLDEIAASDRDEEHRRRALGLPPRRREVTMQPSGSAHGRGDGRREPRNDGRGSGDRRAAPGEPRHDARPSDRRGPPGPPRNEGRGPADRRAGPGDSRGDARGPAGRREAPAEARSDRGPENGRAAPPREQRDGQAGQQDGAPRKRRRRRKKPGNGAAPGATIHAQHGAATNGAPHARTDGEASDPRVRERSHDPHRPREVAASPEANGSSEAQRARNGTHDASGAPGPSKRRRRRRRRSGEGQPPTGHPGGAA